jgi:hypothetical protein
MRAVNALPAPALLERPHGISGLLAASRELGIGEKLGLGVAVLGLALCFIPGMDGLFASWQYDLADTTLSLSVGEVAVSASALSVLTFSLGAGFLTAVGAYASKQRLIGA